MLYSLCGVLRLVRFNVKANEAKGNKDAMAEHKKHFTGLPIPAGALAAVSANYFLASPLGETLIPMSNETKAVVLTCLMIILGYFMVSRWKFPSIKALHFRVASFQLIFLSMIHCIFMLYGILYFLAITLATVVWGYIILGWVLSIIHHHGKNEDFRRFRTRARRLKGLIYGMDCSNAGVNRFVVYKL